MSRLTQNNTVTSFAATGYAQTTSEIAEKQPPLRRKRLSKKGLQNMTERKQAKAIRESIVLLCIGIRAQNMGFLCVSVPILSNFPCVSNYVGADGLWVRSGCEHCIWQRGHDLDEFRGSSGEEIGFVRWAQISHKRGIQGVAVG
jgi:hypothetical protein